jgi:dUTP pyrophosphatase
MFVEKINKNAILPFRATEGSAGFDLSCPYDITLKQGINKIPLGLKMRIPCGYYGRIACRSSLACKDMSVEAGVVDEDYQGEIIVLLRDRNGGHVFKRGDRVAQMIITPYMSPVVEEVTDMQSNVHRSGGFGSTGV